MEQSEERSIDKQGRGKAAGTIEIENVIGLGGPIRLNKTPILQADNYPTRTTASILRISRSPTPALRARAVAGVSPVRCDPVLAGILKHYFSMVSLDAIEFKPMG